MDRLPLGFFLQAETIMELPRVDLVCLALYSRELSQAVTRSTSSQADAEAKEAVQCGFGMVIGLKWRSRAMPGLAQEVRIESIQETLAHYYSFQK